jgi:hypothetical protein
LREPPNRERKARPGGLPRTLSTLPEPERPIKSWKRLPNEPVRGGGRLALQKPNPRRSIASYTGIRTARLFTARSSRCFSIANIHRRTSERARLVGLASNGTQNAMAGSFPVSQLLDTANRGYATHRSQRYLMRKVFMLTTGSPETLTVGKAGCRKGKRPERRKNQRQERREKTKSAEPD